jgi:hypothetical protein
MPSDEPIVLTKIPASAPCPVESNQTANERHIVVDSSRCLRDTRLRREAGDALPRVWMNRRRGATVFWRSKTGAAFGPNAVRVSPAGPQPCSAFSVFSRQSSEAAPGALM